MKKRILIVHPNLEMSIEIGNLLGKLGDGYDLSVTYANTCAAAEKQAATEQFDLIITALEIAADDQSPLNACEQCRLGLDLVHSVRTKQPRLLAIIVTDHPIDKEVYDFTHSEGTDLAWADEKFADHLKAKVTRLLGTHPSKHTPERVVLSVTLSTAKDNCTYQFQPEGGDAQMGPPLTIEQDKLVDLVKQSRAVHVRESTWADEIKRIGEALTGELFKSSTPNLQFRDEFNEWKGKVGGIENIRWRFIVEDDLHPLMVEALKQKKDDEYWMLRTAIYRQEPHGGGPGIARPGLFQDDATSKGSINFLIIEADVPANAIVEGGGLDQLPNLGAEVKELEDLLLELKKNNRGLVGMVQVIKPVDVPAGGSFKALVEDTLRNGKCKWHVLHYAGHTFYDAEHHVGYILFPLGGIDPVQRVTIAELALWLDNADTRFVFLSSCMSAGQDFIYQLAKARVPAIMGFLWNVKDAGAREYAKKFYRHLLNGQQRSLEYACLEAKKEMYAKDRDDPIWASPVLVMQVSA